jgi:hypothetical protein
MGVIEGRRTTTLVAATAVVACLVPAARAGSRERIELDAADQAAARAAIVRPADLRRDGWSGRAVTPDLRPAPTCRNYHPKLSDLVLTGAAESNFLRSDRRALDTKVKVLRTARMVRLGWRREVMAAGVVACQRRLWGKSLGPGAKVVSFTRIRLSGIARYAVEFRGFADVPVSKGKRARLVVDGVRVSRGRSEISLVMLAPAAARAGVAADVRRFARLMVSRLEV